MPGLIEDTQVRSAGDVSCPGRWWAGRGEEVEEPRVSAPALCGGGGWPGVQLSFSLLICSSWDVPCPRSSQEGICLDLKTLLVTDEAKVPGPSVPPPRPEQARGPGLPEGRWRFEGEHPRASRVAVQLPV